MAVLLAVSMAGCAKSEHGLDPAHPVTIKVWHYYNSAQKNAFDAMVDEFNETVGLEKGIVVEGHNQGNVEGLSASVAASMNQEVGSQPLPNIFQSYSDVALTAVQRELLVDLDQYFTKEEQSEYVDSYIEEGRIGLKGELVIFPVAKSTEILMINKTDWDKFAVATGAGMEDLATKEGVVRAAEAYYRWTDSLTPEIPDDGRAFYGRDALANLFIVGAKQLGSDIFQVRDGQITLNLDKDVMRRIWDVYYVPTVNGYFGNYGRFRSDDAKVGKLIALTGSTSSAAYFPTEVTPAAGEIYPVEAAVLPCPVFEGGEPVYVQQGAGMVVVKSTPPQEYASVLFLEWFTEAKRNLEFSYNSGYLPVRKEGNSFDLLMQVSGEPLSRVKEDTLRTSLETVTKGKLYTHKAFGTGNEARKVLEYSLFDKTNADRKAVEALMMSGVSREDAVARYDTDANFDAWYQSFKTQLEEAVQEK